MFYPLSLYISIRYLRAKRRNHFISFITAVSMLGISLGVMVLVTVLSIMNGFDATIREKIFDTAHHITLQDMRHKAHQEDWQGLRNHLLTESNILGVAPFLVTQGLFMQSNESHPVAIYGVIPSIESSVSSIHDKIVQGSFQLMPNQNHIIVGEQLAVHLNITLGARLMLYLPVFNKTLLGVTPRAQEVTVVGIFRSGKGIGLDNTLAYMHLQDLQALYQRDKTITGLRLKTADLYQAPQIAENLAARLPPYYIVSDWTARYGGLMAAISLEKTMTLWILLLLIAIATFNLVSSLVMMVTEKRAEIAIFRTLGMRTHTILSIFILQGSLIGIGGTILGLSCGFLLSQHISTLANIIAQGFHTQLFASSVFIHELPSKIEIIDFIHVALASIGMSVIATIYPAWRATKTIPVETLRYE